jgi:hypothetical protein
MNLTKDILGLIVHKLEFKDVLSLRASCKHFDICIRSYNKYWFLRWLIRVYRFKNVFNSQLGKHKGCICKIDNFSFELPFLICICPNYNYLINKEQLEAVKKSPLYFTWIEEYKKNYSSKIKLSHEKIYLEGYCNMKYFQTLYPDYVCEILDHYSKEINPEYLIQYEIGIINNRLIEFYDTKNNYFHQYINFKPKHVRCNCCKRVYDKFSKKSICVCASVITDEGIEYIFEKGVTYSIYLSEKLLWYNSLPKNLKKGKKICDDCIKSFIEKGILEYEHDYSIDSEDSSEE